MLPHWDRSCWSNFLLHPVTVYWHRGDQSQREAPGRVATGVPNFFRSLVWVDPEKSRHKRDSNLGSSALEADALTTRPTRQLKRWRNLNTRRKLSGKIGGWDTVCVLLGRQATKIHPHHRHHYHHHHHHHQQQQRQQALKPGNQTVREYCSSRDLLHKEQDPDDLDPQDNGGQIRNKQEEANLQNNVFTDCFDPPPTPPPRPLHLSFPPPSPPRWPSGKRPPRERKIPGSNPACAGIFSGSSHTSDLKIGTPLATLPGAWRYRDSAGTGWSGVSIMWVGKLESWICNFCLSAAARKIVWADPSLRYTSMLLGR